MVGKIRTLGNFGEGECRLAEEHFNFGYELFVYELFGRFPVHQLCREVVEKCRGVLAYK